MFEAIARRSLKNAVHALRATLHALLLLFAATAVAEPQIIWQIGIDDDPFASGYNAAGEFSVENYSNDNRPGKVTRMPGDPLYNATNNPAADDDFYLAGTYPSGFNGLTTNLVVPNPEPNIAFERALTDGDRTNRVHFFLTPQQAGSLSRLRLTFELVWGVCGPMLRSMPTAKVLVRTTLSCV
jgi:hypothetical protein